MSTTVTLLLFSGRRDPSWELTAGEAAELETRLADVALSATESEELGYRGFRVESDERRVIVRGVPDLERFLLETGRRHLDGNVVAAVEASL